MNGPGTPRPLNRPKLSLVSTLAANGLPDSTDNKDLNTEQEDGKESRYDSLRDPWKRISLHVQQKHPLQLHVCLMFFLLSEVSASEGSPGSSVKNKHPDAEEDMEAEQQEVKRLKFSKDSDEDEEDEEEEQEVETLRASHASKEAEAMVHEEEEKVKYSEENDASTSALTTEDQGKSYFFVC